MKATVAVAIAWFSTFLCASAQVIYDNSTTGFIPVTGAYGANDELADDLTLTGNLPIGLVHVRTWAPGAETVTLMARIYDRSGQAPPAAILATRQVTFPQPQGEGWVTFDFNGLAHATNEIWFSLQWVQSDDAGYLIGNTPTMGSSTDAMYFNTGSSWVQQNFGSNPIANFKVRVEAVPEPATLAGLAVALALLSRRRRAA